MKPADCALTTRTFVGRMDAVLRLNTPPQLPKRSPTLIADCPNLIRADEGGRGAERPLFTRFGQMDDSPAGYFFRVVPFGRGGQTLEPT